MVHKIFSYKILGRIPVFLFMPFIVLMVIFVNFYIGLSRPTTGLPSALIGQSLPEFEQRTLAGEAFTDRDIIENGQVSMINIFASWCVPCLAEHPQLQLLQTQHQVPIYGVAWNDSAENIQNWLNQHGSVFDEVIMDQEQYIGLELGVYGVPESYIIDKNGIIRYRLAGVITEETLRDEILPIIEQWRAE